MKKILKKILAPVIRELLKEDVCFQLETSNEVSYKLLEFLMEKSYFPTAIWEILNDYFQWKEKEEELKEKFPPAFINYVYANIDGKFNLKLLFLRRQADCVLFNLVQNVTGVESREDYANYVNQPEGY